jgi:hypothetical protein
MGGFPPERGLYMRTVIIFAATLWAAGPVWAQTPLTISGRRTLPAAHVMCTDLPVFAKPAPTLFIKGGHNTDGHNSMYKGEIAVLNRTAGDGLQVGQHFFVRRLQIGTTRGFPADEKNYGMVRTAGWVTVTAMDEVNALATIDFSCDSIETGDYLEPFSELAFPTAVDPMDPPNFADRANILFGTDTRITFGDGDTVNIDRGTVHGVAPGARFAIYRNIQFGLPMVYVGDAVVLEQGELTSKVVLVRIKDVVQQGDVVVPRRTP